MCKAWPLLLLLLLLPACGKRHAVGFDSTLGLDAALVPDLPRRTDLPPLPDLGPADQVMVHDLAPKPDAPQDAGPSDLPDLSPSDLPADLMDQDVMDQTPVPDGPQPTWVEMLSGTPVLSDVWGLGAADVFAVGKSGTIRRFNGASWSTMTTYSSVDFRSVWGASASQVLAAGISGLLRFDGNSWSPSYNQSINDIVGSSSASNVYAVASSSYYPQIIHRPLSSPGPYWSSINLYSVTQEPLNALWVVSDTQMYAVGQNGTIIGCTAANCTSNAGWSAMTSGTSSHLTNIFGFSGSDIFTVGLGGTILHYDGSGWSQMAVNTSTYFYGVWGSSPTDVYAVGHPLFQPDESIFHYDGQSWSKAPPPTVSYLNAVWGASAKDVFAVGNFNILRLK